MRPLRFSPLGRWQPSARKWHGRTATATVIAAGFSAETDSAFSIPRLKLVASGVGAETDASIARALTGGGTSLVSWSAVSGATGYRVYWDTTGGPPYSSSADVGNVTSYTPAGLTSGVTYYFNVRAYDESGLEGPYGTQLQKVAP